MSTPHLTERARLVDLALRGRGRDGLIDTLAGLVLAGRSAREMAAELESLTGIRCSYETVRGWVRDWQVRSQLPESPPRENAGAAA